MARVKVTNPRKKKLDALCTKLATFIVTETYTDEADLQKKLTQAIELLDAVAAACVVNDEKAASAQAGDANA